MHTYIHAYIHNSRHRGRAPAVSLPAPMFNTPHQRASRPAMGDVEDRPGAKGDQRSEMQPREFGEAANTV